MRSAESRSRRPRAHFPLRLTHARQYCKERFALVGDAAHSIHPLAGQGVNLGFLDCAALVQVLAQEIENGGDVEALAELRVLRRYERWRKSENLIALGLVDGLNRLFSNSGRHAGLDPPHRAGAVDRSALAKRFFMGRAMGTAASCRRVANVMSDIFVQAAPQLGNQYRDDAFLRSYLQRKLPAATLQHDRAGARPARRDRGRRAVFAAARRPR